MPDPFDDETRCRRCGRCCVEKVRAEDGVVVFTDIPCAFLDPETRLCRVYPDRFERQPRCSTARHSAAIGALPHDCPYVDGLAGYPLTSTLEEHPEIRAQLKRLFPNAPRPARRKRGKGRGKGKNAPPA